MKSQDGDPLLTLNLLNAVEKDSFITQRSMAKDLGIALGLANSYLKRCATKGLIKMQQAPANRYVYYLTPKGFLEKSRLTVQYLSLSFDFFRHARLQCSEIFSKCVENGWSEIALVGVSDLSEIAVLCAHKQPLKLVGVVDDHHSGSVFLDLPVVADVKDFDSLDVVIIMDLVSPQETFEKIKKTFPYDRILAPKMLNISVYIREESSK